MIVFRQKWTTKGQFADTKRRASRYTRMWSGSSNRLGKP